MKVAIPFLTLGLSLHALAQSPVEVAGGGHGHPHPRPLVLSDRLQDSLSLKKLLRHARQLQDFASLTPGNPNRAFGSEGHNATVKYIKKLLDATGYYDTYLETFNYTYAESKARYSVGSEPLVIGGTFTYGPAGDVQAALANVNAVGCTPEDYSPAVADRIALILRGECDFGLKVALAGAAGAVGAIIYNNADASVSGTLAQPSRPQGPYVPVVGLDGILGRKLAASVAASTTEITFRILAESKVEERYTPNLIATTKGGDKNNVVFAGAHSDSVPAGPGINDDGSGTISILEIALELTKYSVKNAVRFGFWTAEEFGLVGSEYHVTHLSDEARQKIALYLNFDMLASPNSGYFVHNGTGAPEGSEQIQKVFEDWYAGQGLKSVASAFSGSSDYGPFLEVGIPSGGLLAGASGLKSQQGQEWWGGEAGVPYDVCYHIACDTVDNLRTEVWLANTKAAAHTIATYARSIDGIPRGPRESVARLSVTNLSYEDRRHAKCDHGPKNQ